MTITGNYITYCVIVSTHAARFFLSGTVGHAVVGAVSLRTFEPTIRTLLVTCVKTVLQIQEAVESKNSEAGDSR